MVGRFEGLATAALCSGTRQQLLIHLQVSLKIECVARGPALLPRQRRQKLSAERRGIPPQHGTRFGYARGLRLVANDRQGAHGQGQQRLSLQQSQKVAVERSVNL